MTLTSNSDGTSVPISFNEKRPQWEACLYADDVNSVGYQVHRLQEDSCDWMTINESRRFTPRSEDGNPEGCGLLHGLLDRCFYSNAMLAVTRQYDRNTGKDRNKDVWSLRWLLEDLKQHAHLLTRTTLLEGRPVPIDLADLEGQAADGKGVDNFEMKLDLRNARRVHAILDALTGTDATHRSRNDHVREDVFDRMLEYLQAACHKINTHCLKFLKHAATAKSKSSVQFEAIALKELMDAVIAIHNLFVFISEVLIPTPEWPPGTRLPLGLAAFPAVKLFDELAHIETPLVASQDVSRVRERREELMTELSERHSHEEFLKILGK